MEPALYVIAILGCGEGELPCEQVRIAEQRYESRAACTAATEAQLVRYGDLPYPVVVAQCRPAGAAAEPVLPREVDLPAPADNPVYPVRGARAAAR